jgi:hypothetical protein
MDAPDHIQPLVRGQSLDVCLIVARALERKSNT